MPDKKNNDDLVVNGQHRVYVDPTYGLRVPDAEVLADTGVVTNGQEVYQPGSRVTAGAEDVEALEATGVARAK